MDPILLSLQPELTLIVGSKKYTGEVHRIHKSVVPSEECTTGSRGSRSHGRLLRHRRAGETELSFQYEAVKTVEDNQYIHSPTSFRSKFPFTSIWGGELPFL